MATNVISINRGDTFDFLVALRDKDANLYTLQGNDVVYFGLMDPNQSFEDALVKKRIDASSAVLAVGNTVMIHLDPEDTVDLLPGRYFYMVKLLVDHEDDFGDPIYGVITLVNKTKFVIYD